MSTAPKLQVGDEPLMESADLRTSKPASRDKNLKPWWYKLLSFALVASMIGLGYWTRSRWEPILEGWIRPAAANRPKPRAPVVSIAQAKQESVPQFINCLGTVTAFNSVTVKSRVDGELVEVAFQEGQMVQEGQLLARIDSRSFEAALNQAKGQLQRDSAALELARLNVERSKNLPAGGTLSQQERDELDAVYKQAQALVDVDRALVSNAQLQVAYCNITAPITGRVGLRQVDQGNMIQASNPNGIAVITQLQPISVVFSIPQDEILRVQKQLSENAQVPVIAFDRTFQNQLAQGTLAAIDNQVDPTTGTLRLKANFENVEGLLFPNQFVNIRLLVKQWSDAVVIPSSAVQRGADFQYVYVVQSDNETVDIAKVQVAFSEAGRSVVSQGLQAGDRVVIEGTDKLQPKGKISLPGAGPKPQ
jgi:multidrug efflux system membrane fusion protein